MKKIFILCAIFLAMPFAFPYSETSDAKELFRMMDAKCFGSSGSFLSGCQPFLDEINSSLKSGQLPNYIFSLFGNKKINLTIKDAGKNYDYFIQTSGSKVDSIAKGKGIANMLVETDLETVAGIAYSNDWAGNFVNAIADKKIKYSETGSVEGAVKTTAFNLFSFVAGVFKGISSLFGFR